MDQAQPLFTIVTPTLNASGTLEEAIFSVLTQGVPCEHIIMDGGSADRTVEIASSFPGCTVHSGRDRGLYDAMNRGAFFARGEWLVFLQADDWLPDGALASWREAIKENPDAGVVTGSAEAVRTVGEGLLEMEWQKTAPEDKNLTARNIALGEPMINARAIRKGIFKKVGPFDLAYSLASDRDFLLKLAREAPVNVSIDALTYRYRWHEGSRTMNAGNSLSRRLTAENIAIAGRQLSEFDWAENDASALRIWHGQQSIQAAICALEDFDVAGFFRVLPGAVLRNPVWPFQFLVEFARCFTGWVGRGFRTRSALRNLSPSPNV